MALKIEKKEKRTMGEIDFENVGFGTLAIHAGQEPDKLYGALARSGSLHSYSLDENTGFDVVKNIRVLY